MLPPGRLGRIEKKKGKTNEAGAARAVSEGGEKPPPYVLNWRKVKTNSNLALAEEKLEWLLKCVPPGVNEGCDTLWPTCKPWFVLSSRLCW